MNTIPAIHFVLAHCPLTRNGYTFLAELVAKGSPDVPASTKGEGVEELCFYGLLVKVADRYEVSAKAWQMLADAEADAAYVEALRENGVKVPEFNFGGTPLNKVYGYFTECMVLEASRCEYSTMRKVQKGDRWPDCSNTRLRNLTRGGILRRTNNGYELTEYAEDKMLRGESRWYRRMVAAL